MAENYNFALVVYEDLVGARAAAQGDALEAD